MPKFGEDYEFPDELEKQAKQAAEEKVEIEIEDDTPPEDRGRKPMKETVDDPTDDELSTYDEKVQARIKKFTRGYHDERRAKEQALREREAAEAYARQVLDENRRLQQQIAQGSKVLIETSKSAAASELEAAKEKYRKAYEQGDVDAVTEAQAEVARATVALDRAASMQPVEVDENRQSNFVMPPAPAPQRPPISQRTQRWIEDNADWWNKDEEMTAAALGLDKKLTRQYGPDYVGTKEYFRTIDQTLRKRFPEYFESRSEDEDDEPPRNKKAEPADEDQPPRRASRPATVVAPATRSTPPSRIKLKASEAAIARRLGVSLEDYAKQVAMIERGM